MFHDDDDEPNDLLNGPELWDLSKSLCDVDINHERILTEYGKELMPLFDLKAGIINLLLKYSFSLHNKYKIYSSYNH